ncbi:MAG: M20/M25/M40 family metallo-hydrolase, partial [Clostridia bacterium]|nr:M20/M25/M40 family metallo-hydrolase [Clostridia bacterium]
MKFDSNWLEKATAEAYELLLTLAQIPAPSGKEEKRAAFCLDWLTEAGAEGVYIDQAKNVIYPMGDRGNNPLAVIMAHSDVVFPDLTPLPLRVEDGKIHCPGVGDDTANAVAVMMAAKYVAQNKLIPGETGLLLVVNSCEEGLGNLRGTRKLMETYGSRITEFISLDGGRNSIVDEAVGSHRYKIEVETEGG